MKKEQGVLGKLLSIVGVVLVVTGVFVFQNISRAEDEGAAPAAGSDVVIPDDGSDGSDLDSDGLDGLDLDGDGSDTTDGADMSDSGDGADNNDVTTYTYAINYYASENEEEHLILTDSYTGAEAEYTMTVTDYEPVSEAGDFIGWVDENGKIYHKGDEVALNSEKLELKMTAKFAVLQKFTMIYYANGGVGAPSSQTCESYFSDCEFTLSTAVPTREGFEFKGWQKEGNDTVIYAPGGMVKSHSSAEPLLMKAVWAEIRTFSLIYEGNGGSDIPAVQTCKSADGKCNFVISTAVPVKNGSQFGGWLMGGEAVQPGIEITATETTTILIASWNPIFNFKLTYIADDAKDVPEPQNCETAMGTCTFIIPDKEPTKDGYKFMGWRFEDKADMLAKAGDELIVGVDGPLELKIVAVWSRIYTVLNSGEVFGAGERVVIRSTASFEGFKEFTIDDVIVPDEYFSVTEGATSIMLSNAYAQSLSNGEHAFLIKWEDGEASGIISVNQSEDGTKRFTVVDVADTADGSTLMYRPKAGAVSKESTGVADAAMDNEESNFDAVRTLILVAVGAFVVVYIVNRFYVHHKMNFIEEI